MKILSGLMALTLLASACAPADEMRVPEHRGGLGGC